jgi:hypothetical protein
VTCWWRVSPLTKTETTDANAAGFVDELTEPSAFQRDRRGSKRSALSLRGIQHTWVREGQGKLARRRAIAVDFQLQGGEILAEVTFRSRDIRSMVSQFDQWARSA